MNKPKKVPLRRCLGCGESFPKKDLIRIVRTPDQTVALDFRGKMSGRGAYIRRNAQCLRKAQKANRISRNLEIEIPDEVFKSLEEEIESAEAEERTDE